MAQLQSKQRRVFGYAVAFSMGCLLAVSALAQSTADISKAAKSREEWRGSRESMLMDDFGELARYREDNAQL